MMRYEMNQSPSQRIHEIVRAIPHPLPPPNARRVQDAREARVGSRAGVTEPILTDVRR